VANIASHLLVHQRHCYVSVDIRFRMPSAR